MNSQLHTPATPPMHPNLQSIHDVLAAAKTVFITAHVGPDGDTLGTMLGLRFALLKGFSNIQQVDCVIAGMMPQVYGFLPGLETVVDVETTNKLLPVYDVAISVDCGSKERLGPAIPYFDGAKTSINLDHHISNQCYGNINLVIPDAAASGEVAADVLEAFGIPLDKEIATCFYTALLTDTGGFRFSNTSSKALLLASRLVEAGANPEVIYKSIYEQKPLAQTLLHAESVLNCSYNPQQTIIWTVIHQSHLNKHQAPSDYLEGVVDILRHVQGVKVAALFKETTEGHTKVSLRSNDHGIDVAAVMAKFGGGGHKMAAGCTIQAVPEQALSQVLALLDTIV